MARNSSPRIDCYCMGGSTPGIRLKQVLGLGFRVFFGGRVALGLRVALGFRVALGTMCRLPDALNRGTPDGTVRGSANGRGRALV